MGAGAGGKKQREVYVGNLTIGSVNDVMLKELFNGALAHLMPDAATNPPVVNVAMDPSGMYAFTHRCCLLARSSAGSLAYTSPINRWLEEAPHQFHCKCRLLIRRTSRRAVRLCGDAHRGAGVQRHGYGQDGPVRQSHQCWQTQGICGAASGAAAHGRFSLLEDKLVQC